MMNPHHAADVAKTLGLHHHSFICRLSEFEGLLIL